jgi:hypothetical protein
LQKSCKNVKKMTFSDFFFEKPTLRWLVPQFTWRENGDNWYFTFFQNRVFPSHPLVKYGILNKIRYVKKETHKIPSPL